MALGGAGVGKGLEVHHCPLTAPGTRGFPQAVFPPTVEKGQTQIKLIGESKIQPRWRRSLHPLL